MGSGVVAVLLYLAGLGTGWTVFEDTVVHQHLTCPKVGKVEKVKKLVVEDCVNGCSKEFEIKISREIRGEIDRFANDCRSFEDSTYKLVDSYNTTMGDRAQELEKKNKDK